MGLIVDTSILIRAERQESPITKVFGQLEQFGQGEEIGISSITVAELTHGIYRAVSPKQMKRWADYLDEICRNLIVHPLTESIARLLGQIEGEQASLGITIGFEDLAIGATALALAFSVVTHNVKHFDLIPNLTVHTL